MKFLFIQQDVLKNYGVMILSAVIKSIGHECDILIDSLEKDIIGKIKAINPDIIGFSITTSRYSWMRNLAKRIKSKFETPIIVGAHHPTFFPEIINEDFIDIICIGEGGDTVSELLERLKNGKDIIDIKNLWVKRGNKIYKNSIRNLVDNLDSIPHADRVLYDRYPLLRMQNMDVFTASRGCPYNCSFCFNKKYNELYSGKGKVVRRRSVPDLIDEIKKAISRNRKVNHLFFVDDNFTLAPRNWLDEFFKKYKEVINLPFSIPARADSLDEDIIEKLKRSGCNAIKMGLESANPYLRNEVLKKQVTNEQVVSAIKAIKKHGIKLLIFNILGTPGETIETALETYEFSYRFNPEFAWCSLMQPYPGTEIMEIAEKQNLIKNNIVDEFENSYFSTTPLDIANKKEIVNLQKLFQFGNVLRIPKNAMRHLIKLPSNKLFELIFKITYAIGHKKTDNLSWGYLFSAAIHSRNYFSKD